MKAIEVEKKVRLEPHHIKKVEQKGLLLHQQQIQDRYFDTADYHYTMKNMWLRQRNNAFELKVGIKSKGGSFDHYEEIDDENTILDYLGANAQSMLSSALAPMGMHTFCIFVTHRTSIQLDGLKIDIDVADFGDLTYQVAEIEVMVASVDEIHAAEQKIFQFTKELGIDTSLPVPAKITYYLYYKRAHHYQALVQHQVIAPILLDCLQPS